MKSLCNLNNEAFGSIDALQDDLLFSCFQEHEAYNALINYSKFLAIGKKGAGKTAIFKMIIQQSDPEVFTVGYNLSDYPWHHRALQAKNDVPENEKFIQSWMYLMLIAIAKIIINEDQSIPYDRESNIQLEVMHKHIPNYGLYLRVIKKLGKSRFTTAEFIDEYNKTIENGNPEKCLEELYRFSMIGNYVVGGNSGGSQKIFKYKNARNELNVDEPIIVHPGLVSALGIKEKKAKSKKEELAFA